MKAFLFRYCKTGILVIAIESIILLLSNFFPNLFVASNVITQSISIIILILLLYWQTILWIQQW